MKKTNLNILIGLLIFLPLIVLSQKDFEFPISELGNCTSQEECKIYCDDPSHIEECLDFAVKIGDMTQEKASRIREMNKEEFTGPGGCIDPSECREFCDREENIETCLQYDVDHGFMTQEKANQIIEKVRKREEFKGPGNCSSKEECEEYCNNPENAEECLDFAIAEGRMEQEKADEIIQKIQEKEILRETQQERGPTDEEINSLLQEQGGGPGGCMTQNECDVYCGNEENAVECMEFAKKHGLMDVEKVDRIKNSLSVGETLGDQGGPGGCRSKEECEKYCSQEENQEECINFGKDHGMMTSEQAQQLKNQVEIKKEIQIVGGLGGCMNQEECKDYCNQEENKEECLNFSLERGLINEVKVREVQKFQEIKQRREIMMEKQGQSSANTEVRTEKDMYKSKDMILEKDMMPQGEEFQEGMPPQGEMFDKPKDMMPQGEMPGENMIDHMVPEDKEKGFGPQSLLETARSFLANLGFVGLVGE